MRLSVSGVFVLMRVSLMYFELLMSIGLEVAAIIGLEVDASQGSMDVCIMHNALFCGVNF